MVRYARAEVVRNFLPSASPSVTFPAMAAAARKDKGSDKGGDKGSDKDKGSEPPPAATSAVQLTPLPRPHAYYADALKNVLDVFPATGTPVAAAVLAESFSSPFLRQQFGAVKLQEAGGWPASAHKGELPSLPRAANSRSHTSLSHTMLSTPLVPRPLSQHSAVPRQRPLSRAERAQGREWQGRHKSLATRGISAYEARPE